MHPRSPYETPPDFNVLADAFPPLRRFVSISNQSHANLNFKDPDAQRTLTQALLHRDLGLSVDIPHDRIIPPVPNRLNYVLWIQDLVYNLHLADASGETEGDDQVHGIDVGTGASAIYPLLACRVEATWSMIGTEIDSTSAECAQSNVAMNKLHSSIQIITPSHGDEGLFFPMHRWPGRKFTFTMCNPPFYASEDEMQRSEIQKALAPRAVLTASNNELISTGGEVAFVSKMVHESLVLRDRCRWFTSMLGHLSSLSPVVEMLRSHGIKNYAMTELIQGRTRRWVIGWSFDDVRLPDNLARIHNLSIQSLQPLRNTLLHPMMPAKSLPEDKLNLFIKDACQTVPGHIIWSLPMASHVRTSAIPSISPISPPTGFLISLKGDTWSRTARRKAKQQSSTSLDIQWLPQMRVVLMCHLFWTMIDTDLALGLGWVRGEERALFESFSSHIVGKVRIAIQAT